MIFPISCYAYFSGYPHLYYIRIKINETCQIN